MMKKLLLTTISAVALTATAQNYRIPVSEEHEQMQTGQFEPTWESLETHQTPEWFRDAKFGIWAHWGAQCVEGLQARSSAQMAACQSKNKIAPVLRINK